MILKLFFLEPIIFPVLTTIYVDLQHFSLEVTNTSFFLENYQIAYLNFAYIYLVRFRKYLLLPNVI